MKVITILAHDHAEDHAETLARKTVKELAI